MAGRRIAYSHRVATQFRSLGPIVAGGVFERPGQPVGVRGESRIVGPAGVFLPRPTTTLIKENVSSVPVPYEKDVNETRNGRRLPLAVSLAFLFNGGLKTRLQFGEYRPSGARGTEMHASELGHERLPHAFTPLFEELRADGKLFGSPSMSPSPGRHLSEQRHKLYGRLGQTVDGLLLVGGIAGSG